MKVDRDELLKEIERCEYEKRRLVVWTQMDEFRLQVMKQLAAANATIERLSAPVSDAEMRAHSVKIHKSLGQHDWIFDRGMVDALIAARAQESK